MPILTKTEEMAQHLQSLCWSSLSPQSNLTVTGWMFHQQMAGSRRLTLA